MRELRSKILKIPTACSISLFILAGICGNTQNLSEAEKLLSEVDQHLTSRTLKYHLVMEITYSPGDERTVEADVWAIGRDSTYLEYTQPARERDTRYLKIGKSLWIFKPKLSKSVLIQGHMLRQGVMGGDFSYEDMLESGHLLDDYTAEFAPIQDTLQVLELTAKTDAVTYQKRVLWIDPEKKVPRRSELRTKSDKLLKSVELSRFQTYGKRYYPTEITMRDHLKQKSQTVMRIVDPVFDDRIDPMVFTRRYLERQVK